MLWRPTPGGPRADKGLRSATLGASPPLLSVEDPSRLRASPGLALKETWSLRKHHKKAKLIHCNAPRWPVTTTPRRFWIPFSCSDHDGPPDTSIESRQNSSTVWPSRGIGHSFAQARIREMRMAGYGGAASGGKKGAQGLLEWGYVVHGGPGPYHYAYSRLVVQRRVPAVSHRGPQRRSLRWPRTNLFAPPPPTTSLVSLPRRLVDTARM